MRKMKQSIEQRTKNERKAQKIEMIKIQFKCELYTERMESSIVYIALFEQLTCYKRKERKKKTNKQTNA